MKKGGKCEGAVQAFEEEERNKMDRRAKEDQTLEEKRWLEDSAIRFKFFDQVKDKYDSK